MLATDDVEILGLVSNVCASYHPMTQRAPVNASLWRNNTKGDSLRMGYLPKEGVSFELIELQSGGRTVQGGFFGPDPKLFHKPGNTMAVVHGVESY